MVGCRCSYKTCMNTTKSDTLRFFHYPVKYRERCTIWIEKTEKPSYYDLEEEQLRNKVVCEVHFEDKWFHTNQRRRLVQGAIPTLDGDNLADNKSKMDVDPVYFPSNQYSDVKVVPANDDGTVFVLDTDNMFTISPKIQSYIIKNGILVPATSNGSSSSLPGKLIKPPTNRFIKPSDKDSYILEAEKEIANINAPPGASKFLTKGEFNQQDLVRKVLNRENQNDDSQDSVTYANPGIQQMKMKNNSSQSTGSSTITRPTPSHTKSSVTKNYLRQIKRHSRDIANIKRMLKQKKVAENPKPDVKMILKELQEHQVPPSLVTIISLLLGKFKYLTYEQVIFNFSFQGSKVTWVMRT